jgi:hypothetical protein
MGLEPSPSEGEYLCGKGVVCVLRKDPKEFVLNAGVIKNYLKKWMIYTVIS